MSALSGVEISFEYADDNDEDEDDDEDGEEEEEDEHEEEEGEGADAAHAQRPVYITREQIMQLLGGAGLGRIFASDFISRGGRASRRVRQEESDSEYEEEGEDDTREPQRTSRRLRRPRGRAAFEKVPSEQGTELMNAGTFGSNPRREDTIKRKKRLAYNVMQRELGLGSNGRQKNTERLMRQGMIPESVADTIIHYNARCYSGQFSDDGNFFFSCAQDFRVRMYDTSNPYDWKYYKVSGKSAF